MKDLNFKEFISKYPKESQEKLIDIKNKIEEISKDLEPTFGYGVPAFKYKNKYIFYYSAFKNHIGLYPTPIVIEEFKEDLKEYELLKVTVKISNDKKIPFELLVKMIKFNMKIIDKE